MRFLVPILVLLSVACDDRQTATAHAGDTSLQTVSSVPSRPAQLSQPPILQDEAPPPRPKALSETADPVILSPEDERFRASLPFTPAIAMDPVDGSKISMRAVTPTFEYKGKVYYFSSEANRKTFAANPEQFVTGGMLRL